MNRRHFLTLAAAIAPVALLVPELWVPSTRSIFLPPTGGWAQPSLAELWLAYANLVRPAGVLVRVRTGKHAAISAYEDLVTGVLNLELGEDLDAATEARVRRSLLAAPAPPRYPWNRLTDYMPWADAVLVKRYNDKMPSHVTAIDYRRGPSQYTDGRGDWPTVW